MRHSVTHAAILPIAKGDAAGVPDGGIVVDLGQRLLAMSTATMTAALMIGTFAGEGTASAGAGPCDHLQGSGQVCTVERPGVYRWVVPPGIERIEVHAFGAEGGAHGSTGLPGGLGGMTSAVLNVRTGQHLFLAVGGAGGNGAWAGTPGAALPIGTGGAAGYNGGGRGDRGFSGSGGGGGGGGATDIRTGRDLASRIIVAGGGGGAGATGPGGAGSGADGTGGLGVLAGQGASRTGGGMSGPETLAGYSPCGQFAASPPSPGMSGGPGEGGPAGYRSSGAGAGGGGYYGGGGGASNAVEVSSCKEFVAFGVPGGPGGGGSGFIRPDGSSERRYATGVQPGHGKLIIKLR